MNALAPYGSGRPLMPQSEDEATAPLLRLFSAYPAPWVSSDAREVSRLMDARVAAYRVSMHGIPGWAIMEAVNAFLQGRVDRRKRDVLPTGEELAVHARAVQAKEADRQAKKREEEKERREGEEWRKKQEFLRTAEGEEYMARRKRFADEVVSRAYRSMESE